MASQLGKRYRCQVCGTEILCVKSGEGVVTCCSQEMEIQEARVLPSSD
ncbi:desulfoferrodoxin [Chloroflexota bacterium]